METMKALVIEADGKYGVREVPIPEYGEYQALVKMESNSMCGTDLKIFHNNLKNFADYPTIVGHEGIAKVVAVGKKVTKYKVGDRVITPYTKVKCGDVYSTWGAMAEYACVADREAMEKDGITEGEIFVDALQQQVIPSDLDPVAASMIVTFREICLASKRMQWKKGESIVIYGCGPVGLTFVKFAKLYGLGPIIATDFFDEKLETAKKLGADYTFNGSKCDFPAEVKKILPEGADVILDAAGVPELIDTNVNLVRELGRIYVYGVLKKFDIKFNLETAPFNFTLAFVQWPTTPELAAVHDEVMQFVKDGKLDGMDFISDVYDFDHVMEATELFLSGKAKGKITVRF